MFQESIMSAWRAATRSLSMLLVLSALCGYVAPALGQETASRNAVRGGWRADGLAAEGGARWEVAVTRQSEDAIEGTVTLEGSPLMARGSFRGTLDGRAIAGTISDEGGRQVATFAGRLTERGVFEGRYEDRTGAGGRWTADAP